MFTIGRVITDYWQTVHALWSGNRCPAERRKTAVINYKKLSYRRGTARCVVSVEILPIATQVRNSAETN